MKQLEDYQNKDREFSVKSKKQLSQWETRMSEFESKMHVFLKDNRFEGFESLLNQLDSDHQTFKNAAKNDFLKLKDRVKQIVDELNDVKIHNENQDREIDTLKRRKQLGLIENEDIQSDMQRVSNVF